MVGCTHWLPLTTLPGTLNRKKYQIQNYVTVQHVKQNSKKIWHNPLTLQPHIKHKTEHYRLLIYAPN